MTAALDRLCALITPPANPVCADGDWAAVEAELGPLSTEWKTFIRRYGSGTFYDGADPVYLFNPLTPIGRHEITSSLETQREEMRAGRRFGDEDAPYPGVHPECPGSLPWGCDDQRAFFGWLIDLDPERWTTVCSVETRFRRFPVGLADFLLGTLCRVGLSRWYDSNVYAPRGDGGPFPDAKRVRFYTADVPDHVTRHRAEFPREES